MFFLFLYRIYTLIVWRSNCPFNLSVIKKIYITSLISLFWRSIKRILHLFTLSRFLHNTQSISHHITNIQLSLFRKRSFLWSQYRSSHNRCWKRSTIRKSIVFRWLNHSDHVSGILCITQMSILLLKTFRIRIWIAKIHAVFNERIHSGRLSYKSTLLCVWRNQLLWKLLRIWTRFTALFLFWLFRLFLRQGKFTFYFFKSSSIFFFYILVNFL